MLASAASQKLAATALWVAAKLEEVRVVRDHPRKLLEMVMVAVDRSITRRETPEGRKLTVLDTHSKVGAQPLAQHRQQSFGSLHARGWRVTKQAPAVFVPARMTTRGCAWLGRPLLCP